MDNILRYICDDIYNELGGGYSESCYHRCVEMELQMNKIKFSTEIVLPIKYKSHFVGYHRADLILYHENGKLTIVELKATSAIVEADKEQVRRYMRCVDNCNFEGYLINFGKNKLQFMKITI